MSTAVAIRIEPGALASHCKMCGRVMYWGVHPTSGRACPVSVNGELLSDARPPTRDRAGAGTDHHIDCVAFQRHQAVLREHRAREQRVLSEQTELSIFTVSRPSRSGEER